VTAPAPVDLLNCARRIRLLCLDVDGVLTDAGMYYGFNGEELKKFNTRDAMGMALLREQGVRIALISGEDSPIVSARAAKLKIEDVYRGASDKRAAIDDLRQKYGYDYVEIAYVGDDLNDLPALDCVGLPCAVSDAARAVRAAAFYVTSRRGGDGAVREVCDLLLAAGKGEIVDDYALVEAVR
jgi:3-deoxy-D-manno-octulosonate 8-phosphate phosphatase (KDO 8-P phosphatase)